MNELKSPKSSQSETSIARSSAEKINPSLQTFFVLSKQVQCPLAYLIPTYRRINPIISDIVADSEEAYHEYGVRFEDIQDINNLDALIASKRKKSSEDSDLFIFSKME